MRILHLTDFHYSKKNKNQHDQHKIIDSLVNDLKDERKIDFLFFTGDLVNTGENQEDFFEAKKILIDRLVNELSLDRSRAFICCGNHDIHRGQELQDTTDKIKEINSNDSLENFLKRQEGKSFQESLKNIENYNGFQKEFYKEYGNENKSILSDLYTTHVLPFNKNKIGILTLNSAWRSIDSNTDRGNLLFPISILKEAIINLKKDTDFRVVILHHPISDFKDWNASEMEDLLHKEFHLLFSGHLHKKKQSIQICTDEGIFCCTSPATLTQQSNSNGYSIIDVDIETYDIEITNLTYNNQDGIFLRPKAPNIKTAIPVGEVKRSLNEFKKTLRKKYYEELDRANELFISYDDKEKNRGFMELFTDPILKHKTKAQIAESKVDTTSTKINEVLSSSGNKLIVGKDKSGKTSILYKLFLDSFVDFSIYKTIPLYIDVKDYKASQKSLDIYKIIGHYYEMNYSKAKELPNKYPIRLFIDNYEPSFTEFNKHINSFLEENASVSFIATTEEKLADTYTSYEFNGRSYTSLYIHEISRPEVRLLANKWPNITPEKKELILEKIFGIFTQLNIPTNYWTVSLFLWIFEKNNDANFHNSFELIELYIDNLLDKKGLAIDKSSKLKFADFKAYLAELAYFLMMDRAEKGYTASYSEVVEFTKKYRERNKRFVIEVKDIIDLIIEKGILRKTHEDHFTFRLNGVFEYFIALYMTLDKVFAFKIIEDDHYYLSFKNELELYAGFEKNNTEYLYKIFERTKRIYKNLNDKYLGSNIDEQLNSKISEVFDITVPMQKLGSSFQKSLTVEKQDEILAEMNPHEIQKSEVKIKHYYDQIEDNSENLEKALHILARVFRNTNLQDEKQINEILDYILVSSCHLGFKLIDEAESSEKDFLDLGSEQEKVLVQLLTNFMPLIVQTFLYDAIAQNDLERIFKEKINELKINHKKNQFKLLILYFTLIDLDVNANKEYIKEVIELIDMNILRQTTILKLYYYLMFKCNNRPHLEEFIQDQIRLQTLKINPKADKGELQKGILKTTQIAKLRGRK
jgi:2',3'-cyclic-nucleotide 2'-phosphodiesterase (5'-nucleotidase family)